MRVGTPPVLALASLEAALDVWDMVDMAELRAQSIALSQLFIAEIENKCPMLKLGSPRDPNKRGSQVAFHFQEGYAAMQALIERGVIGDFRVPDTMRFGFTRRENNKSMIAVPFGPSKFPVGSSARRILGCATTARASATRCCSPPDSCAG